MKEKIPNLNKNISTVLIKGEYMKLGAFSVSLNVKDIKASKQFYEILGFTVFGGDMEKNFLIMKNENSLIGLFQGMFENNILTFNPGWDENANKVESFEDVRDIQRQLKTKGIKIETEADENSSGPASFVVVDPDGNAILIDQHV
jgi:predicted lactoylglutathione lyase